MDTIYQLTVPDPSPDCWIGCEAVNFFANFLDFESKSLRLGRDKKDFYDYLAESMFTVKSEVQQVASIFMMETLILCC